VGIPALIRERPQIREILALNGLKMLHPEVV
jgi:hypothetical protein